MYLKILRQICNQLTIVIQMKNIIILHIISQNFYQEMKNLISQNQFKQIEKFKEQFERLLATYDQKVNYEKASQQQICQMFLNHILKPNLQSERKWYFIENLLLINKQKDQLTAQKALKIFFSRNYFQYKKLCFENEYLDELCDKISSSKFYAYLKIYENYKMTTHIVIIRNIQYQKKDQKLKETEDVMVNIQTEYLFKFQQLSQYHSNLIFFEWSPDIKLKFIEEIIESLQTYHQFDICFNKRQKRGSIFQEKTKNKQKSISFLNIGYSYIDNQFKLFSKNMNLIQQQKVNQLLEMQQSKNELKNQKRYLQESKKFDVQKLCEMFLILFLNNGLSQKEINIKHLNVNIVKNSIQGLRNNLKPSVENWKQKLMIQEYFQKQFEKFAIIMIKQILIKIDFNSIEVLKGLKNQLNIVKKLFQYSSTKGDSQTNQTNHYLEKLFEQYETLNYQKKLQISTNNSQQTLTQNQENQYYQEWLYYRLNKAKINLGSCMQKIQNQCPQDCSQCKEHHQKSCAIYKLIKQICQIHKFVLFPIIVPESQSAKIECKIKTKKIPYFSDYQIELSIFHPNKNEEITILKAQYNSSWINFFKYQKIPIKLSNKILKNFTEQEEKYLNLAHIESSKKGKGYNLMFYEQLNKEQTKDHILGTYKFDELLSECYAKQYLNVSKQQFKHKYKAKPTLRIQSSKQDLSDYAQEKDTVLKLTQDRKGTNDSHNHNQKDNIQVLLVQKDKKPKIQINKINQKQNEYVMILDNNISILVGFFTLTQKLKKLIRESQSRSPLISRWFSIIYAFLDSFHINNSHSYAQSYQEFIQIDYYIFIHFILILIFIFNTKQMRRALTKIFNSTIISKQPKALYSTGQKKNVFVLPKKQFIHHEQINAISSYTYRSQSVRQLAYLFRDNIKSYTDAHVGAMWQHMANYQLVLDETLYSLIIPITLQYINAFSRNNATALGSIAISAALLKVQSDQLWTAIFKKLHNEDIYRYLTLKQTVELFHALAVNGKFVKHALIPRLEAVITKQKAYYDHHFQLVQLIKTAVSLLEKNGGEKPLQLTQAYKLVA